MHDSLLLLWGVFAFTRPNWPRIPFSLRPLAIVDTIPPRLLTAKLDPLISAAPKVNSGKPSPTSTRPHIDSLSLAPVYRRSGGTPRGQ